MKIKISGCIYYAIAIFSSAKLARLIKLQETFIPGGILINECDYYPS